MVPYGTGTVSANGTQIVPNADPAHPGHLFGLVHFDWHGPMPPPPLGPNPGPDDDCPGGCPPDHGNGPQAGDPVDLASGLQIVRAVDIAINGPRGSITINRIYRTLSNNPGPFGVGTGHDYYSYQLGTLGFLQGQGLITLITPDGNQYPFIQQPDGTFTNSKIPSFRGAAITNASSGIYQLRFRDGKSLKFQAPPTAP